MPRNNWWCISIIIRRAHSCIPGLLLLQYLYLWGYSFFLFMSNTIYKRIATTSCKRVFLHFPNRICIKRKYRHYSLYAFHVFLAHSASIICKNVLTKLYWVILEWGMCAFFNCYSTCESISILGIPLCEIPRQTASSGNFLDVVSQVWNFSRIASEMSIQKLRWILNAWLSDQFLFPAN